MSNEIDNLNAEIERLKANLAFEEELRGQFIEEIWQIVGDGDPYDYPAQVIRYTQDMKDELKALKTGIAIAERTQ